MSSKRAIRRRTCGHKIRHTTVEAARVHIGQLHHAKGYCPMNAYRCSFCGGWHVGHRGRS